MYIIKTVIRIYLRYVYVHHVLMFVHVHATLLIVGTIIEGPSNVTYIPGKIPLPIDSELICNITDAFITWRVNAWYNLYTR